jgi:hypothetical protein
MAKRIVATGTALSRRPAGIYGRSADWIVEDAQTDAYGIRHARLVGVANPTVRNTLAAEVMLDPARFEQV